MVNHSPLPLIDYNSETSSIKPRVYMEPMVPYRLIGLELLYASRYSNMKIDIFYVYKKFSIEMTLFSKFTNFELYKATSKVDLSYLFH